MIWAHTLRHPSCHLDHPTHRGHQVHLGPGRVGQKHPDPDGRPHLLLGTDHLSPGASRKIVSFSAPKILKTPIIAWRPSMERKKWIFSGFCFDLDPPPPHWASPLCPRPCCLAGGDHKQWDSIANLLMIFQVFFSRSKCQVKPKIPTH